MSKTITIIGAGLTGCFLSILLAKRGYKVTIYERTSKDEIFTNASKRSFNLTFYGYGVQALKEAGLWEAIKPNVLALKGSITQVGQTARPITARLDKEKMPYYTVSRSRLLQILIKQAMQHPLITIHFEKNLTAINRKDKTITLQDGASQKKSVINCDVVLGTDGVNSYVRQALQEGQQPTDKREYAAWTYKQISLPKDIAVELSMKHSFMHAWTRKNAIFTAFPNADGSFAAMLILPKNETEGFASLASDTDVKTFIHTNFPKLTPAIPTISKELNLHPESYFVTVSTTPWYYKDFLAVLGDAAHAFLPFYGQGISTAFADCMEFVRLMDTYGTDWEKIFPLYQETRKQQTDVLGELSKESFARYIRTKRADYSAIYDRVEKLLHMYIPGIHPPLFMSVATDPIRAVEHFKKHRRQRTIAKYLGVSLAITALTGLLSLYESIQNKK